MPELQNGKSKDVLSFPKSIALLDKSVALPITVNMNEEIPNKIYEALAKVIK